MPSISTSQTSPVSSLLTPEGVPVAIRSPGISVIMFEMYRIKKSTGKTICENFPCCRTSPLTRVVIEPDDGSNSVSMNGPTGQTYQTILRR